MAINVDTITLRRPDDWHVHLRDGAMLDAVVPFTVRHFARAIVMPNLVPPVTGVAAARAYCERILAAVPAGAAFTPLMTCYLTDTTDPREVARGWEEGVFAAVKLYPTLRMPLLIHGEATGPEVDVFDREAVFIDRVLEPLRRRLPELRIVLEHITTEEAVAYVGSGSSNLAATITAHHLVINRNAIFAGGIRPHLYCLPIAKREKHRRALRRAATSGNPRFFLGTDSAPHPVSVKETACGCAGIFTAPCALEIYAEVFEEEAALDRLEAFAALNGPEFYRLPINRAEVTLRREPFPVQESIGEGENALVPFRGGETLRWRLAE